MKYLLSVDGGGTKTKFQLCDTNGALIGECESGSSNYKSVGSDGIFKSFQEGIVQLEALFGVLVKDIGYSVWGISGCDSKLDYRIIETEILRAGFTKEQFHLCNDGILAYYAQAQGPGIVVIAGTGSIVLGMDDTGKTCRAGGWGYNISDVGSGYWIGLEALRETLLYCDGCRAHSKLFDVVGEYFECTDIRELPYLITEVTSYFEIAKFSRLVTDLAEKGEPLSESILQIGAEYLANLVTRVYENMGFKPRDAINIVYSGGVMKNEGFQRRLTQCIENKIPAEHVTFVLQKQDPSYGGVRLAMQLYGGLPT